MTDNDRTDALHEAATQVEAYLRKEHAPPIWWHVYDILHTLAGCTWDDEAGECGLGEYDCVAGPDSSVVSDGLAEGAPASSRISAVCTDCSAVRELATAKADALNEAADAIPLDPWAGPAMLQSNYSDGREPHFSQIAAGSSVDASFVPVSVESGPRNR